MRRLGWGVGTVGAIGRTVVRVRTYGARRREKPAVVVSVVLLGLFSSVGLIWALVQWRPLSLAVVGAGVGTLWTLLLLTAKVQD